MANKGKAVRWLFGILILASICSGCNDPIKDKRYSFVPLAFNGNGFSVISERVTKEHYNNVEKVLIYYKIEYRRLGPTEIKLIDGLTPEVLMNFSNKAENEVWMAQRERLLTNGREP